MLRKELALAAAEEPELSEAFSDSLKRADRLRSRTIDHASQPFSGKLPQQEAARRLIQSLQRQD